MPFSATISVEVLKAGVDIWTSLDIRKVSRALGHSSVVTTERYYGLNPSVETVWNWHSCGTAIESPSPASLVIRDRQPIHAGNHAVPLEDGYVLCRGVLHSLIAVMNQAGRRLSLTIACSSAVSPPGRAAAFLDRI